LSKKFISSLYAQKPNQEPSFEAAWPVFSPGKDRFSSFPSLKEVEAKALKEIKEKTFLIEKEAYEKGFEQGEKDGQELGLKRLERVIHQFEGVLVETERQRKALYEVYEKEMLRLVFEVSKRLLRHELQYHEEVILKVLREVFQYVTDRKNIVVHLNPLDYQYLLNHPEQLPFSLDEKSGVSLIEDPSIGRGGCLLDTSFGEMDMTIDSQIEQIASLIWQKREERKMTSDRQPG